MTIRLLVRGLSRPAWAVAGLLVLAGGNLMGQLNRIASVAYVEGQVEILRYGSQVPMPAEVGMTLLPGDQIKARQGKCQLNVTTSGILRLSPGMIVLFPTLDQSSAKANENKGVWRMVVGKTVKNFRQVAGLDPEEVFEVRGEGWDLYEPAPPDVVAARAKEDAERLAQSPEGLALAEYRSLLPAVLQAERKPWHTRFEFIANAVKTDAGYRVAYKTYCLIDTGPDAGKDYACYEFDTVLDIGAVKAAIPDMRRRLGR